MTQKRFVKLMMAHEIQRNQAEKMARAVEQYGSYKEMYQKIAPTLPFWTVKKRIVKAYNHISKQIKAATAALVGGLIPSIKSMMEQYKERQAEKESKRITGAVQPCGQIGKTSADRPRGNGANDTGGGADA